MNLMWCKPPGRAGASTYQGFQYCVELGETMDNHLPEDWREEMDSELTVINILIRTFSKLNKFYPSQSI